MTGRRAADERGVTLVELMVAMAVLAVVISVVLGGVGVMVKDALSTDAQGVDTDYAAVAIAQVANVVGGGYWPFKQLLYSAASGYPYSSACSGAPLDGTYQPAPMFDGPVFVMGATDLAICSLGATGGTTAYTYSISLVDSAGNSCTAGRCTLVVDRWPAAGSSSTPSQVYAVPNVDYSGTTFTYQTESNGVWSPATAQANVFAVTIEITVNQGRGEKATVRRTVAMANYTTAIP